MLKITIMETATDRRWIVQGRLVGPWVNELRKAGNDCCGLCPRKARSSWLEAFTSSTYLNN